MAMTDVGMIQDYVVTTPEYESGDFEHEPHFSVTNVYDMASEIGKDFEHLIDAYGVESISGLMPKVIGALEQLERLASQAEAMEETMLEFKCATEQLDTEKRQKARDRLKYERDVEAIEERMRSENQELSDIIVRLQEENKRLLSLRHSDSFHNYEDRGHPDGEETEKSTKMTSAIEKLQHQLAVADSQIASKNSDLDSALAQNERLTGLNKELRRKIKYCQSSIRCTAEEKAELLAAVQIQKKEINTLKCQMKLLNPEKYGNTITSSSQSSATNTTDTCKSSCQGAEIPNANVKGEERDSDEPYFTTAELKEIIWERNTLKTKLSDLTDIIAALKKNELSYQSALRYYKNESMNAIKNRSTRTMLMSLLFRDVEEPGTKEDDDAPVQGPLPLEPEDAPWKRSQESGVRNFFRKLFGSTDTPFGFLQ